MRYARTFDPLMWYIPHMFGEAPVRAIVACNVYVSEGRSKDVVSKLLQFALSCGAPDSRLVHMFVDPHYNRSSFHFVGSTLGIIRSVGPFCWEAWTILERRAATTSDAALDATLPLFQLQAETDHPAVGYIDHVAVLPLTNTAIHTGQKLVEDNEAYTTRLAAMKIGEYLEDRRNQTRGQLRVLYYGLASPNHTPLATVRRNHTRFFQQQQLQQQQPADTTDGTNSIPTVTIGAPETFVENYNIRLHCNRAIARTLTKRLRTVLGIEALTLAYDNVYEVACNLTNDVTTDRIEREVSGWLAEQVDSVQVLRQYRVGTTALQCQQVWAAQDQEYERHIAAMKGTVLDALL
jgi:glutamate formiminotransferase